MKTHHTHLKLGGWPVVRIEHENGRVKIVVPSVIVVDMDANEAALLKAALAVPEVTK